MTSLRDSLTGPWRHRLIHVRGQRLHIAECGRPSDPLVLFIHGSTGGWFEWREVLPLLNDDSGDPPRARCGYFYAWLRSVRPNTARLRSV